MFPDQICPTSFHVWVELVAGFCQICWLYNLVTEYACKHRQVLSRRPEGSTNQAYSSCFKFRTLWILMGQSHLFWLTPRFSAWPQKCKHKIDHNYYLTLENARVFFKPLKLLHWIKLWKLKFWRSWSFKVLSKMVKKF